MINDELDYLPSYFSSKGFFSFIFIILAVFSLFFRQLLPMQWLFFCIVEVLLFFYFFTKITIKWRSIPTVNFIKLLFRGSLLIRLAWVFFSYFFYLYANGKPFEFFAADSLGYHTEGIWLAELLHGGKFSLYKEYIGDNYSDMGYPGYLGVLYYFFGANIIISRIIKACLGAYVCLFTYKIARNNFGESTGRIAGIMTMLLPNLIYYCGLHLKETEMLFLVVYFIYLADNLIRERSVRMINLLLLVLIGVSIFFFRTVLGYCLVGSVFVAVSLTSNRVIKFSKRLGLIILVASIGVCIFLSPMTITIEEYIKASDQNLKSQMNNFATREGSNKLARYGSRGAFLPFMLVAPFPTLINVSDQTNTMMLGGAFFTRNVYAFFVFIALYVLYKRKQLREHVLLLSVVFSYIFVLASSGFALSERFHLPLVPFLAILASYGISQMNGNNKKYYIPYLALISVLVIGWNWFKLAGRS